jgi:hypothetical protein
MNIQEYIKEKVNEFNSKNNIIVKCGYNDEYDTYLLIYETREERDLHISKTLLAEITTVILTNYSLTSLITINKDNLTFKIDFYL